MFFCQCGRGLKTGISFFICEVKSFSFSVRRRNTTPYHSLAYYLCSWQGSPLFFFCLPSIIAKGCFYFFKSIFSKICCCVWLPNEKIGGCIHMHCLLKSDLPWIPFQKAIWYVVRRQYVALLVACFDSYWLQNHYATTCIIDRYKTIVRLPLHL